MNARGRSLARGPEGEARRASSGSTPLLPGREAGTAQGKGDLAGRRLPFPAPSAVSQDGRSGAVMPRGSA
jgi:hypothetical protein